MYNFIQLGAYESYAQTLYQDLYSSWVQSPNGYWDLHQVAYLRKIEVIDLHKVITVLVKSGKARWTNTIETHFTLVKQTTLIEELRKFGF